MNALRWFVLLLTFALLGLPPMAIADDVPSATVRIGILSFRDRVETLARWQPITGYLKQALPGWQIELDALHYPELEAATSAGKLDFVLTQPAHYVLLAYRHGLSSPLATLVEDSQGLSLDRFGGVIVARAERQDLNTLSDLRGQRLATSAVSSLGSYQMQAYALLQAGIRLPEDARIVETGQPQDLAIDAVVRGDADVAFVRTGLVESLRAEGKIMPDALKVIAPQHNPGFPLLHSTALYPEWALAAMSGVNQDLARQLAAAMLAMPHRGETAKAVGITGFTIPRDYHPMEDMLRKLRAPPFDATPNIDVSDIWVNYQGQIAAIALVLSLLLAGGSFTLFLYNRHLRAARIELKQSVDQLTLSQSELRKLSMAIEQSPESVVITSTEPLIEYVNETFVQVTGYSRDEVIGQNPRMLSAGLTGSETYASMWQSLVAGHNWRGRLTNRRKNGQDYQENVLIAPVRDKEGRICNYLAFKQDITTQVETEAEVYRLAHFDPLTGLCNRPLLMERISQALAQAHHDSRQHALLLINMDRFKTLNDACGHTLGDQLLVAFGGRLAGVLEDGDTLARMSADEFALLLPGYETLDESASRRVMHCIEQIQGMLRWPFMLGTEETTITASIGVAFFPQEGSESAADVLRRVGTALHGAKAGGGNLVVFFDRSMGAEAEARFQIEHELRRGISQGELRLYCQSQVSAEGAIQSGEILVRWQHPQKGLTAPGYFVPVAEASDLIIDLECWVIGETCQVMAAQQKQGRPVQLSVNVSPRHFARADFADWLCQLLHTHGVDPAWLTLEVTEGLVIQGIDDATAKMKRLSDLGIHFSLDDFGTGYSSLSYLKLLPFHELKIDKSFIQDAPEDDNDARLVEAILAVAQQFQLSVVAEGVETQEQADFLNARAKVIHQGYLYGRPEPIAQWLARIKEQHVS